MHYTLSKWPCVSPNVHIRELALVSSAMPNRRRPFFFNLQRTQQRQKNNGAQ